MSSNVYLSSDEIEELHVEVSTLCNASCPMCARNYHGYGLTPNPGFGTWKRGDEDRVFTDELKNLKRVIFCGTHGDPLTSPFFLETVDYIRRRFKNVIIEINTNGSLRTLKWWNELLDLLQEKGRIVFGVDGIDTNHLYRQGTDIDKILERMEMTSASKTQVQWDFLVFKHNEHELEYCKKLAKDLNIDKFRVRRTARFKEDKFPVLNKNKEVTHYLEPPFNEDYKHPSYGKIQSVNKVVPTDYEIKCTYKEKKRIYVNSRLEVFPCCYISDENEAMKIDKLRSELDFPIESFNLRSKSWSDILNHPFYKNELVSSFNDKRAYTRCVKTCGVLAREDGQNLVVEL